MFAVFLFLFFFLGGVQCYAVPADQAVDQEPWISHPRYCTYCYKQNICKHFMNCIYTYIYIDVCMCIFIDRDVCVCVHV